MTTSFEVNQESFPSIRPRELKRMMDRIQQYENYLWSLMNEESPDSESVLEIPEDFELKTRPTVMSAASR